MSVPEPPYRMYCENPECDFEKTLPTYETNLPTENKERIARIVAGAHEHRPRFGDEADEEHPVVREWLE